MTSAARPPQRASRAPVTLFMVDQPAPLYLCQAGQPCPPRYYKLQACDSVTWHFGDGSPDVTATQSTMITHAYAAPGIYSATATVANALGSIHGDGDVTIDSGPAMTPPPPASAPTLTPASIQITTGTPVSLRLDIGQPAATNMVIPLQSSLPDVAAVPASAAPRRRRRSPSPTSSPSPRSPPRSQSSPAPTERSRSPRSRPARRRRP